MYKLEQKYIEDLQFMLEKYEEIFISPYYCYSKKELMNYINNYLAKNTITNDFQFLYFLKTILKRLNGLLDSHTCVNYSKQYYLPFSLKVLDNEIYVVKTNQEYKKLLYSKIKSINKIPYNQIVKEIENSISYGTEGWRKSSMEYYLTDFYSILNLPSIDSEFKKIKIVFKTQEGKEKIVEFNENDKTEEMMQNKENCSFHIEKDTIHYIFKSSSKKYTDKLVDSVMQLKRIVEKEKISNFILDLRDNSGGSSSVIVPLLDFLKNQRFNLYTFVNRSTFSSGLWALENMIQLGSITIGEDVGSTINHFGNVSNVFKLPNTRFSFELTNKFFTSGNWNNIDKKSFRSKIKSKDLIPVYYPIDILVEEHIQNYIEEQDIYMNKYNMLNT